MLNFVSSYLPEDNFVAALKKRLRESNLTKNLPDEAAVPFVVRVEEDGQILGGIHAQSHWSWMQITVMFVETTRQHQGIGASLLGAVETEAIKRNCAGVLVVTNTKEAPGFYEKNGFVRAGEVPNCPPGCSLLWYIKKLK